VCWLSLWQWWWAGCLALSCQGITADMWDEQLGWAAGSLGWLDWAGSSSGSSSSRGNSMKCGPQWPPQGMLVVEGGDVGGPALLMVCCLWYQGTDSLLPCCAAAAAGVVIFLLLPVTLRLGLTTGATRRPVRMWWPGGRHWTTGHRCPGGGGPVQQQQQQQPPHDVIFIHPSHVVSSSCTSGCS
jgi:hypothetical protein